MSELSIETQDFELVIAMDSSDVLYKLSTKAKNPTFENPLNALKEKCIEMKGPDLLSLSSKDLSFNTISEQGILYALKKLVSQYQGSDIYSQDAKGKDISELVCRCNFLDKKDLQDGFRKNSGDFKKTVIELNASLICSSCSSNVKMIYKAMNFEDPEKREQRVGQLVQQKLADFSDHCAIEFKAIQLNVANVKNRTVKIRAHGDREGLSRDQIKTETAKFLGSDLPEDFEISIFF